MTSNVYVVEFHPRWRVCRCKAAWLRKTSNGFTTTLWRAMGRNAQTHPPWVSRCLQLSRQTDACMYFVTSNSAKTGLVRAVEN